MARRETLRRYLIFTSGVLISATGIAFVTRAGLGTSPISSIPFVLSLITPVSMGAYTFSFNMLFLIGEVLLVRRFSLLQFLQIPATVLFGFFIDAALAAIPTRYGWPWLDSAVYLIAGCAIMALGIYLEVLADVIMLPCEAFVRALSRRIGKKFGNVKVFVDSSLTVAAAVLALFAFGKLNGVREGTLINALLVGQLVKLWGWVHRGLSKRTKIFFMIQ